MRCGLQDTLKEQAAHVDRDGDGQIYSDTFVDYWAESLLEEAS